VTWRLPPALKELRDEADVVAPFRNRSWDGTIGDAAHASRMSDHNPDPFDPQHDIDAIDITHDPVHGWDCNVRVHQVRKDPRTVAAGGYVIFNRVIWSQVSPEGRPYHGSNPHDHHMHVSIGHGEAVEESTTKWLPDYHGPGIPSSPPPKPNPHQHPTPLLRIDNIGSYVEDLQHHLNHVPDFPQGADLAVDGDFGPRTESVVRAFQLKFGLYPDGVVGAKTWAMVHLKTKLR
jgi:hypothetical protein